MQSSSAAGKRLKLHCMAAGLDHAEAWTLYSFKRGGMQYRVSLGCTEEQVGEQAGISDIRNTMLYVDHARPVRGGGAKYP